MGRFTVGEVRAVLDDEENTLRFEDFCNRLVTLMNGQEVLGTTATSDQGVDGRSVQLDMLARETQVAASTRVDAVPKMQEDAERIRETQEGGSIYFCTTQRLSELKKAAARKKVRAALGSDFTTQILTQDELAELAVRYEGPFQDIYEAEIVSIRQRVAELLSGGGGSTQLQIAHALSSDDGFANRSHVAELLVTELLARSASTANEILVELQALLRMPSTIPRSTVDDTLNGLAEKRVIIQRDDGRFQLTDSGREGHRDRCSAASHDEQARKTRLFGDVETRLGHPITAAQQEKLWKYLMHEMSELLGRLGARFVALVEAARTGRQIDDVRSVAGDSVRSACRKTVASITDAQLREETEEALYQSLLEVPDIALDWLENVIAAWLAACQLGLVPEISNQLRPAVLKLVLALDTDIVLSMLSDAEPDSAVLNDLLAHWAKLGGRTFIAPEVLKEVAHHAWIARTEFAEISSIIKKLPYDPGLAREIARNVFVRAFWASKRPVTTAEFERFIRSFAGTTPDDTSSVEATIARFDLGHRVPLPSESAASPYRQLGAGVRRVLARVARFAPTDPNGGAIEQDKMDRDAAATVRYATIAHSTPSSTTSLLILSSSRRFGLAVRKGAPNARLIVARPSTLGLLLATVLTNQLRPQAIAQLLLAEGAHEQVNHLRSELVRMLARADLLDTLPRAKVVTLEREVETSIVDFASRSAQTRQRVRQQVLAASDKDASLQVLGEALRRSAIGAEADRIIRSQAEEIKRLREATR